MFNRGSLHLMQDPKQNHQGLPHLWAQREGFKIAAGGGRKGPYQAQAPVTGASSENAHSYEHDRCTGVRCLCVKPPQSHLDITIELLQIIAEIGLRSSSWAHHCFCKIAMLGSIRIKSHRLPGVRCMMKFSRLRMSRHICSDFSDEGSNC